MTTTTASPSLVLLNPTAPTAKPTVAADTEAAPGAASSGFQLLLGNVQQLQQKLSMGIGSGDAASKNSDKINTDSGNGLPLLGLILPLTALPQADTTAQAGAAGTTKSKDEKDQDTNTASTDLMQSVIAMPTVPAAQNIQPRLASDTPSTDALASTSALTGSDAALAAQSRLLADAKADSAKNKTAIFAQAAGADTMSTADRANVIASMFTAGANSTNPGASVNAAGPLITTGANTLDAAAGVNADMTATAAAFVKEVQGASKHLAESDFDALVKHFDTSTTQPALSAATVGGSANTHQTSASYANAASNNVSVSVPVGNSGWSDAVADKVMWFSANKISSAEIHLNPPDLGPLQVRVSTQHDQASVVFTSQHAAVRDALDQALPRLRDMMGSQGMHLLDVSVGGQSAQQQQQQFARNNSGSGSSSSPGGFFADDSTQTAVTTVTTVNTAQFIRSGVDAYA